MLGSIYELSKKGSNPTNEVLEVLRLELAAFTSVFETHQAALIEKSGLKDFQFHQQLLRVMEQVLHVSLVNNLPSFRDKYMADNVEWWSDFYKGERVVVWAHDLHIGDISAKYVGQYYKDGNMGAHLTRALGKDYKKIGFSFSGGTFTARSTLDGEMVSEPQENRLYRPLPTNVMNDLFTEFTRASLIIPLNKLAKNDAWNVILSQEQEVQYVSIGAVFYANIRHVHFIPYDQSFYDILIHFNETNATTLLK